MWFCPHIKIVHPQIGHNFVLNYLNINYNVFIDYRVDVKPDFTLKLCETRQQWNMANKQLNERDNDSDSSFTSPHQ